MIYVYKDRIINVEWTVLKGTSTVKENFDRALVKLFLIGPHEKFLLKANAKDGIVSAEVPQGLPEGVYSVEIIYIKNWLGVDRPPKMPDRFPIDCRGNDRCIMRSRKDNLFAITEYESEATEIGEGEVVIRVKTSTASYGYDGLSAYEIAVLRGDFEGTEGEWLEWTHERIVTDVKDLLDKLKSRDTRFVVKTKSQRDNLKDLREGDEVYVIDDGIAYILETENGKRTWKPCDYGTVTSKYILSLIAGMPGFVADRAIADEFGKRIVDEYLTRDAVRNYMNEVFNDLFINNPPTIMDGMITVDMLSDAVKQLIGFGPIVNFPDDEFLTTKGGRITPKDRNYDPNNYSGMGRKILRKNMVNGVNVLTQKMMSCPNTVYVITYDYSLRGQTITVPDNCVLQFEGGSLKNGTLIGDNTVIEANFNTVIFDTTITIAGTWNIKHIYDSWFAFNPASTFISNQIISNILALSNDNVYNTIHFDADRTYYFENTYKGRTNLGDDVRPDYWKLNTPDYDFLRIFTGFTSNTHLIVNNTIQMLPTNQGAYYIFHIENKENITISGTGAINGDAKDHLYTDLFAGTKYYGEWGHVLNFRSCNNIVIRDITIGYAFGDGIALGNAAYNINGVKSCNPATRNVLIDGVKILYARRNGISLGGNNYSIDNVYFEGCGSDVIKGTAPMAAIDFENDYIDIEPSGICSNVVMSSCKFKDNKYDVSSTIRDDLATIPSGELVVINDCNFTAPLRLNRTHGLTFNSCHIVGISSHDNSISPWYVSSDLIFNCCVFDELNPYLTISAKEQGKKFINPTYPQDIKYSTTFQQSLADGKALKFTIPKPLVGEVEFTAFCSNPNYGAIHMPINITEYTFGNSQRLTGIRDIKIRTTQDSTPRYAMYKNVPVFSYINYAEDTNNFNIYFTIGGNLINDPLAGNTSVNIFLTSKIKFTVVEAPVSENPGVAGMYGGKWSTLSAITKSVIDVTAIPSTITFPSKEMFPANMLADLPTSLTPDKVGFSQFILDDSYKRPVFWDSYSNVFRTADGNVALGRRPGSLEELNAIAAKLTTSDRGYEVYYVSYAAVLIWSGTEWLNVDGSRYETTRIIRDKYSSLTWSEVLGYENLTYIIVGDIDLEGETLTLGNNSTLDFQGGSFSNGTIVGNDTKLEGNVKLSSITLTGTCSNSELNIEWFNIADNDITSILYNLINLIKLGGTVRIPKGTWLCNTSVDFGITSPQKYFNIVGDSGAILKNKSGEDYVLSLINLHDSTTIRNSRVVISGITFDCNSAGGLYINNPNFLEITNCSILNFTTYGIFLTAAGECNVNHCNFTGIDTTQGTSLRLTYNSGDSMISDLSIYKCLTGISLNNTGGCKVFNNVIYGAKTCIELSCSDRLPAGNSIYSNELEPIGSANDGAGIKVIPSNDLTKYHTNTSITDNYFLIKEGAAIEIQKIATSIISKNTISVTSTTVTTSPVWMKLTSMTNCIVSENNISELRSTVTGMSLTSCIHCTIRDNRVLSIEANSYFIDINTGTNNCWYINNYNALGNALGYLIRANIVVDTGGFIDNKANTALIDYNLGTYAYMKQGNINALPSYQNPLIFRGTTTNYLWFNAEDMYMKSGSAPTEYNDGTLLVSILGKNRGITANRPTGLATYNLGFQYYDTTLKKYICWNGTEWVNMDGTSLS